MKTKLGARARTPDEPAAAKEGESIDVPRVFIRAGLVAGHERRHAIMHDYDNKGSLQSRILASAMEANAAMWEVFCEARLHSLLLYCRSLLGRSPKGRSDDDSLEYDSIFWDLIAGDPAETFKENRAREYIQSRLNAGDLEFFVALGISIQESLSPKRRLPFNPALQTIAQYWTHPDYPVWMMNNEAASRFVEFIAQRPLSAENFAQLVKRNGLVRFGRFPIRSVRIKTVAGKKTFLGFEMSRWVKV